MVAQRVLQKRLESVFEKGCDMSPIKHGIQNVSLRRTKLTLCFAMFMQVSRKKILLSLLSRNDREPLTCVLISHTIFFLELPKNARKFSVLNILLTASKPKQN